jgi:hypothetical protein
MVACLEAGTLLKRAQLGDRAENFRKELELDIDFMFK